MVMQFSEEASLILQPLGKSLMVLKEYLEKWYKSVSEKIIEFARAFDGRSDSLICLTTPIASLIIYRLMASQLIVTE